MTSVTTDQQGNILSQGMKKLEIKEMKKSPSAVFSWPSFVNNKSVREIVQPITKTALHPNGLVQVRSADSVRSVLWSLIKNKVQCVPVFNESTRKYIGFIDMFDLVQYIANAAGNSIVKPDFFQVFKRQQYGDTPVSRILSPLSKDHAATINDNSPLGELLDLTVATNLHHIPVMNKQKVTGMISQSDIVKYLAANIGDFGDVATRKLSELHLSGADNLYTVADNVPSITAFCYMIEKGVRGLAVVNSDGKFVDAINSADVKGLVHGDFFSDLRQPVLRYLSKSRILLNKNLAPVVCSTEETLMDAILKMAQENAHRVFLIDSDRKPIQAISLRDILKLLHHSQITTTTTTATVPEPARNALAGSGGQ